MECITRIINFNEYTFENFLKDRGTADFYQLTEEGDCYSNDQRILYVSKVYLPGKNLALIYTHDTGYDFNTKSLYYTNNGEFLAVYSADLNALIFKHSETELNLVDLCKSIKVYTVEGIGESIAANAEVEFERRYPELKEQYCIYTKDLDNTKMKYDTVLQNHAISGNEPIFFECSKFIDPIYHINYKYDFSELLSYLQSPKRYITAYCDNYLALDYGETSVMEHVLYRIALEDVKEELKQT